VSSYKTVMGYPLKTILIDQATGREYYTLMYCGRHVCKLLGGSMSRSKPLSEKSPIFDRLRLPHQAQIIPNGMAVDRFIKAALARPELVEPFSITAEPEIEDDATWDGMWKVTFAAFDPAAGKIIAEDVRRARREAVHPTAAVDREPAAASP